MMPILYPDHTRSDKPFHKQWICWVLVGIAIIISVSTILCAFWFKIRRFFRPDAVENDMDPIWRGNPRPSQPRRSPWQIRRNRNARPRIPAPRPAGQPPLVDWGFKDDVLLVLRTGNWRPWKWNFPKGNQQQGAEQQGIQEQGVPQLTAEERRIQSEDIALQTEQGLPIPLENMIPSAGLDRDGPPRDTEAQQQAVVTVTPVERGSLEETQESEMGPRVRQSVDIDG